MDFGHTSRETLSVARSYINSNLSSASLTVSSPNMVPVATSLSSKDVSHTQPSKPSKADDTPMPMAATIEGSADYFSSKIVSPATIGGTVKTPTEPPTPTASVGSGIMGRLKTFGKKKFNTDSGPASASSEALAAQAQIALAEVRTNYRGIHAPRIIDLFSV